MDKKNIPILLFLLMIFAAIFFISVIGLYRNDVIFAIGIPAKMENWMIIVLSIASIIRIVWELYSD